MWRIHRGIVAYFLKIIHQNDHNFVIQSITITWYHYQTEMSHDVNKGETSDDNKHAGQQIHKIGMPED